MMCKQHDEWAESRRYVSTRYHSGTEALPATNILQAAA